MIDKIHELCKHLDKEGQDAGLLISRLNRNYGHSIDFQPIYELAVKLRLIREKEKRAQITDNGSFFYSMSGSGEKINDKQKQFIYERCILKNEENFAEINLFINNFVFEDYVLKIFDQVMAEKAVDPGNEYIQLLDELDVIKREPEEQCYTITPKYTKDSSRYIAKNSAELSQDNYDESDEEKIRIGQIGEDLAVEYELKELRKKIHRDKRWKKKVEEFQEINSRENIVAKRNIRAGYDVSSFLTSTSPLRWTREKTPCTDKHIEVKSRKFKDKSFFISKGEVKKGLEYSSVKKNSHFIYFYHNLENEKPDRPTKIIPFEKLDIKLCKNCEKYLADIKKFF